ncbi:hypothetical protein O8B93_25610 [Agrobacterium rhizogenes]|uniref:hypothetical protein n=1 Tax=Rhizobium rhizogenes TaxID=359 RepID=UPI0022B5E6AE|nr:hypothetical protein [Rhizobium rhizogenes]MCZ7450955.1 hypothetical protein [Rhizobium rhizogenes]
MPRHQFDLTNFEWSIIQSLLPNTLTAAAGSVGGMHHGNAKQDDCNSKKRHARAIGQRQA